MHISARLVGERWWIAGAKADKASLVKTNILNEPRRYGNQRTLAYVIWMLQSEAEEADQVDTQTKEPAGNKTAIAISRGNGYETKLQSDNEGSNSGRVLNPSRGHGNHGLSKDNQHVFFRRENNYSPNQSMLISSPNSPTPDGCPYCSCSGLCIQTQDLTLVPACGIQLLDPYKQLLWLLLYPGSQFMI